MKYEAVIRVVGGSDKLFEAFKLEEGKFPRSSFDLVRKEGAIEFVIKAEDPTALRATMSSITKLLNIYEKVE